MTQPTPLEQIDLLLAAWDERLRRMDENLVALESEAIYQILAGKAGKRPQLEGATKERVGPALDAVSELFENRERLAAVVARAREVRASISPLTFWEKDDKITEIHRLLRGTSIELGQKVVALSQRNLLDQGYHDVLVAPEQLLTEMATRFQEARTVLLSVSQAWEALDPVMTAVETEMTALRALAAELRRRRRHHRRGPGIWRSSPRPRPTSPACGRASPRIRSARKAAWSARSCRAWSLCAPASTASGGRGSAWRRGFVEARALRSHLAEGHERAIQARAETRREIAVSAGARISPVLDEGLLTGLDEWLGKIEGTAAAHRWSPAEVGLARWRATAEQYAATDAAAAAEAEALLGRRGEPRRPPLGAARPGRGARGARACARSSFDARAQRRRGAAAADAHAHRRGDAGGGAVRGRRGGPRRASHAAPS